VSSGTVWLCASASRSALAEGKDQQFMKQAIEQSEKGRCCTAPNPWVGAVIVAADGQTVLGVGYHTKAGNPHAEVEAVRDAERNGHANLNGAICYTTLEPCHRGPGKRTPPCDEMLVARGLSRVVIGHVDPDKQFGGAGVGLLQQNQISVTVGVCEQQVKESLKSYLHHRQTGKPWVVLKMATSIDGAVSCADGTSQWITQSAARQDSQLLRASSQAILVGSGTALQDNPRLTVRLPPTEPRRAGEAAVPRVTPLRVLLDSSGRVTAGALMDTSSAPTMVFTSSAASETAIRVWKDNGVAVAVVPAASGNQRGLDLPAVLSELGSKGVMQLMVEGGAEVGGSFLQQQLVDELHVYIGATLLGSTSKRWAQTALTSTIGDAKFWKLAKVRQLGDDVCLEYTKAE